MQNLHKNLQSQHEPTASPPKLPIHRSETRTNDKDLDLSIETRANGEKLQLSEQELKRTEKNFNLPNKTQASGEKRQTTDQNSERTVKNANTPNGNSNERWKTPKMVAPAHNHIRISETSRTHAADGKQVLHGPTVGA